MKAGDRVWLMPDYDRREIPSRLPAVIVRLLDSGRVKVTYAEHRCKLTKTVMPARIEPRSVICADLGESVAQ